MTRVGDYGFTMVTALPFDEAVTRMEEALADEGFGVLCDIDVQGALREKLGVETDEYRILGACNPGLARDALEKESELGLLLPCNAVVYRKDGDVRVSVVNAEALLALVGNPALGDIAADATARLRRALDKVGDAPVERVEEEEAAR